MPGLFCSLYPEHGRLNVLQMSPDIGVPGLADMLGDHGYRTAFMHEGQLSFHSPFEFVGSHGFRRVFLRDHDPLISRDSALLPIVEKWIKADGKQPFWSFGHRTPIIRISPLPITTTIPAITS